MTLQGCDSVGCICMLFLYTHCEVKQLTKDTKKCCYSILCCNYKFSASGKSKFNVAFGAESFYRYILLDLLHDSVLLK